MNIESLERPLQMLRKSGTVSGLCLARGRDIIYNLFPFSEERVADFMGVIDDILLHYRSLARHLDQMAFGFDGGNSVVVADTELRLVVFHMRDDEVDFIAKAARAFLVDYQTALAVKAMSEGHRPIRPTSPTPTPGPVPGTASPTTAARAPIMSILEESGGIGLSPAADDEPPSPGRLPDFVETHVATTQDSGSLDQPPAPLKKTTRITVSPPAARSAANLKPLRPTSVPAPVAAEEKEARLAKLASSQPESTLPPPRTPRPIRRV